MSMRQILSVFALCAFVVGGAISPAAAQIPALMTQKDGVPTLAPLLRKITPAVVNIAVKSRPAGQQQNPLLQDPFFRFFFEAPQQQEPQAQLSAGSGVIVDAEKGYVLTNNHVIENAEDIRVTLKDRRSFKARLIGTDKDTDIALLQISADKLTAMPFGDSDRLNVGDFVLAIGNPFGIGQTVTSGIVSALGRSGLNIEGYEDFIQTDASINPGNSGGALVNLRGELVGINAAIIGPAGGNVGIGFAIPVRMARAVMSQLLRYGEVRRGRLGVAIQDVTPDIAAAMNLSSAQGAIISRVDPKSPAEEAGLAAGDVVIAVNGETLRNSSDLRNRIGLVPVGEDVTLTILRKGTRIEKRVRIGRAAAATARRDIAPYLEGAAFADLPEGHPLYGKVQGVVVAQIEPGSPAWQRGLRQGDVIIAVNQRPVADVEAFEKVLKRKGKVLALNIIRGDTQIFLVLK